MTDTKHQRLADRLRTALQGLDDDAILRCFDLSLWFGSRYASAYELQGPIYLVLDNSLIQAFKHRQTNTKRAVDALAFETFCTFVRDWSDRESESQRDEQIKELVRLMLSKPFAEEEVRGRQIREQLADFAGQLAQGCKQASASSVKTATTSTTSGH